MGDSLSYLDNLLAKNIKARQRSGQSTFSIMFRLRAKDLLCDYCCSLEQSLGRLPKNFN